jgi:hypothetical protein
MRKPLTGVAKLDQVWGATADVFKILGTLHPEDRQQVVDAVNKHWQALPVVAAVGGGTAEEPAQLFDAEPVPQMPHLPGASAAE